MTVLQFANFFKFGGGSQFAFFNLTVQSGVISGLLLSQKAVIFSMISSNKCICPRYNKYETNKVLNT